MTRKSRFQLSAHLLAAFLLLPAAAFAQNSAACRDLPSQAALKAQLTAALTPGAPGTGNGGLNFNMWATVVNRDGVVCAVAFTGSNRGDQWPGSRVISAQKANSANEFSVPGFALSSANLYAPVQPGGTLFGLQESNPVNVDVAYAGNASHYGQPNDPMVGGKIGGVNVFGGGLALYNSQGQLVGGLGVSGDTSCADHIVAWKTRWGLNLDNVPAGVAPGGTNGTDNIVHPLAGGFSHPECSALSTAVSAALPATHPVGP